MNRKNIRYGVLFLIGLIVLCLGFFIFTYENNVDANSLEHCEEVIKFRMTSCDLGH